jgi:hypothetical protein
LFDRIQSEPVQLFYIYAHEDEPLCELLENHLSLLRRQNVLSIWSARDIEAGEGLQEIVDKHLNTASVFLLLISPYFLASDHSYNEMYRVLQRHEKGEARVIPIILRPCDWESAPFGSLQVLPRNGRPITTWDNPDQAFEDIARSLRAIFEQGKVRVAHNDLPGRLSTMQNRKGMLQRLQRIYEELLADSLQEVAWVELGLTEQPGVVRNTVNLISRRPDQSERPLPPGTSIVQVYQESNQELLILGEPGAGKSTLLYHLGCHLVTRANQHLTAPLPVVFPLSSWAEKRLSLADWMVEQLSSLYKIPWNLGQEWMRDEHILPLLDGLDEMEAAIRPACIVAINTYHYEHQHPLVICCRSEEYKDASVQEALELANAVIVQPLSSDQLDAVLVQAGTSFTGLRSELQKNTTLREMVNTPLLLNVLLLTFKDEPVQGLPQLRLELQQQLWERYVQRMIERKGKKKRRRKKRGNKDDMCYPYQQTCSWLRWLAWQMREQNQTAFGVELLQPACLKGRFLVFYRGNVALVVGLVVGLVVFLLGGFQVVWLCAGLAIGSLYGLLGALFFKLLGGQENEIMLNEMMVTEKVTWSWKLAPSGLVVVLLGGVLGGLSGGLIGGGTGGLIGWIIGGLRPNQYQDIDRQKLSPGKGLRNSVMNGLIAGLLVWLAFGLVNGLIAGFSNGLLVGLTRGLLVGFLIGLLEALLGGLGGVMQHFLLRFWLWRAGVFPLRAEKFLDDARARHLLYPMGGSYCFAHRLLLEYFADLDNTVAPASIVVETSDL